MVEYTLFLSNNRTNCSIYHGGFTDLASAQASGELAYTIFLRLPRLIISSHNLDISDDATVVPGMLVHSDGNTAVADVSQGNGRSAQVSVKGKSVKVAQRIAGVGWKFTDPNGTKYRWEVLRKEKRWELQGHRGKAVATFDSRQFWSDNYASFIVDEGMDEDLRMLVLLSWALSAKAIFTSKTVPTNSVGGGDDTFTNAMVGGF
ncbi:hypothetical protein DL89DRAFT_270900 [Linderina pennispora]|uniref:DUF6593 domain-containing protein n=1 Tax=Linderina pennispora TaxID=61395 RepID=A0A1Y1VWZ8_9FUNG|nr:uncharacterized protein DL89DRAFT_270900 [Linderina pennispora]ORX65535.1 hypothetical protein DL89DRAFT_270900 [Linderina pennispora]